jgi:hypothetical protein
MPSSALAAALCVVAALLAAGRPCTSQSLPAASSLDGTTLSGLAAMPASEDLQHPVGTFTPTPSAESSEAEPAVPASEDEFALLQALPLPPTFAPASEALQLPVGLVAAVPQPEMFSQADNTLAAKQQLPGFEEGLPADALAALGTVSQPAQAGSEPLSAPPERSNFSADFLPACLPTCWLSALASSLPACPPDVSPSLLLLLLRLRSCVV